MKTIISCISTCIVSVLYWPMLVPVGFFYSNKEGLCSGQSHGNKQPLYCFCCSHNQWAPYLIWDTQLQMWSVHPTAQLSNSVEAKIIMHNDDMCREVEVGVLRGKILQNKVCTSRALKIWNKGLKISYKLAMSCVLFLFSALFCFYFHFLFLLILELISFHCFLLFFFFCFILSMLYWCFFYITSYFKIYKCIYFEMQIG